MENLAHTLLGLSMAKAGFERATPLATTTLVISSNLPDIDVVSRLGGGTLAYLEYHRGITHSFVGLALLAAVLTVVLTYLDRKFRLRRDHRRRPVRPLRVFGLACLGGLGHLFMDFTNSYGVRPFLPFSNRWYYGDLAFVVDPWIWLLLGSAAVWLTATNAARILLWLAIGVAASLLVGLAFREPAPGWPVTIPAAVRIIWFLGLAVIVAGAALRVGRAGARLAGYAILALAFYYGGMWVAHQTAIERAENSLPVEQVVSEAVWPTPANPLLWQGVAATNSFLYTRYINLAGRSALWREQAILDQRLVEALRRSDDAAAFLRFARYTTATVEEREEGYRIGLCDIRFNLCMDVIVDKELAVQSTHISGF